MNTPASLSRIFLYSLILLSVSQSSLLRGEGASPESMFEKGVASYEQGHFPHAISQFRAVARSEGVSASLLYNLGNALFMNKQYGEAILNYHRALVLAPSDADIQANLSLAMKEAGLFPEPQSFWERSARIFSLNGWTLLGSLSLFLLSLTLLAASLKPYVEKRFVWVRHFSRGPILGIVLCCLCSILASAGAVQLHLGELDRAVVLAPQATALQSPFEGAETVMPLKAGQIVKLKKVHDSYYLVEGPAGKKGWLPEGDVKLIVPDPSLAPRVSL